MKIEDQVQIYLDKTVDKYVVGQYEYYARLSLEQSLIAFKEKNYGIGAVAIVVSETKISEYRERNAMVSGVGVVDHAETRALLKLKSFPENFDAEYDRNANEWTARLPRGISVFGTLEPCPMCTCTLTNVGAMISVSTIRDGNLIETKDGYRISDGAANVVRYNNENSGGQEDKFKIQPQVWQNIQIAHKLQFSILETADRDLQELSMKIFTETREEIDDQLARRGIATYSQERAKSLFI